MIVDFLLFVLVCAVICWAIKQFMPEWLKPVTVILVVLLVLWLVGSIGGGPHFAPYVTPPWRH